MDWELVQLNKLIVSGRNMLKEYQSALLNHWSQVSLEDNPCCQDRAWLLLLLNTFISDVNEYRDGTEAEQWLQMTREAKSKMVMYS